MADNVAISAGTGTAIATDQVTTTNEHVQLFKLAYSADGSRVLIQADVNGLLVNVGSLPALPAGSNVIGHVLVDNGSTQYAETVTTTPATGTVALARNVAGGLVPIPISETNTVLVSQAGAIPPGTNEIGKVGVLGASGDRLTITAANAAKVDGSAVTHPVSIASMPSTPVTGTFWQATQAVSLASVPTHGVTGTFWQATQPVSGTFWQATQPVSGTVTTTPPANASTNVAQMAGVAPSLNTGVRDAGTQRVTIATNDSVPVTGTFWQATQAVSLASMPSTPVTGTFWQATQPVSGTFWQATQPVSIASMPSTPVTGTFWQATQPISATALPLPAGAATSANQATEIASLANLDVALSTRTKPGDTQIIQETRPGTVAVTVPSWANISDTTRALTLLSANASRRGATIRNDSDLAILLNEGAVASLTAYTDVLKPGASYTLAYPACTVLLSGYFPRIPTGSVLVTERV